MKHSIMTNTNTIADIGSVLSRYMDYDSILYIAVVTNFNLIYIAS
jgi:hypothetical protein